MLLANYRNHFIEQLQTIYDREEANTLFYWVIEEYFKISKTQFHIDRELKLTENQYQKFERVLERLKKNEPIQYILGKAPFYGYEFGVNKNTLIPRRETEELVAWILETFQQKKNKPLNIIDLGTGSGCIGITLKKENPMWNVHLVDVSRETLNVAQKNALQLNANVHILEADILHLNLPTSYDIIVSNPPYVRELEKVEIKPHVLQNEPTQALFVTDHDPLIFYRKILEWAQISLSNHGAIFFEINQYLGQEMMDLAQKYFQNVTLRQDMQGNDRMLYITK